MKIKSIAKFVVIFTSLNLFAAVAFGGEIPASKLAEKCADKADQVVKVVPSEPVKTKEVKSTVESIGNTPAAAPSATP
jgi:hypothetical protein